jgi:hypothetical protein
MDDGHTFAYQQGVYLRRQFSCTAQNGALTITIGAEEGTYQPWFKDFQLRIFGVEHSPATVAVDNNNIANWNYDATAQTLTFIMTAMRTAESITVRQ